MIRASKIFFQVESPKIQSRKTLIRRAFSSRISLAFVLLLMFAAAIFLPSRSAATDQTVPSVSKRQRPEFVPGEALVRFKPGRAFEGTTVVTTPRKELAAAPFDNPADQIPVEIDRFDGSNIVDGLRIART